MIRATDFTSKNTLNMKVLFALAALAIVVTQYFRPASLSDSDQSCYNQGKKAGLLDQAGPKALLKLWQILPGSSS
ncbi:MAG: hypothetical protein JRN11_05575 [Nitrososphaerota archaeon]|nr:hypothetical protein [Nitrososphaerota archaeon]MDG7013120.1 hypothetical protein [Nitrososphaerota archaeon]MDG7026201.1 hypothetical protein [Nitrososphaerota archaeon]